MTDKDMKIAGVWTKKDGMHVFLPLTFMRERKKKERKNDVERGS